MYVCVFMFTTTSLAVVGVGDCVCVCACVYVCGDAGEEAKEETTIEGRAGEDDRCSQLPSVTLLRSVCGHVW